MGAFWPLAWLVSENVKDIVLAAETSLVSQKTSLPVDCVHVPLLDTAELPAANGRLALDGVTLPVRPKSVIAGRPPGTSAEVALHVMSSGTDG